VNQQALTHLVISGVFIKREGFLKVTGVHIQ